MKTFLFAFGVISSVLMLPLISQAGVNTADWGFSTLTTYGSPVDTGAMSPALNNGSLYKADFSITKVDVTYLVSGIPKTDDVTSSFTPSQREKHVTGVPGPLPSGSGKLYLFNDLPLVLNGDTSMAFSLKVSSYLDSTGKGHVEITTPVLGIYVDEPLYPVTAVSLTGTEHAEVPEPITLGLLGMGAMALAARRRK